jgi:tetratricopeptide (TPR) repeat protein
MFDSETIIKYFDGELDPKESEEIKVYLNSNKDLFEKYQLINEIELNLKDKETYILRNTINTIVENYHKMHHIRKNSEKIRSLFPKIKRYYRIAAAFLILVVAVFTINHLLSKSSQKPKNLFTKYYEPYQKNISNRSAANHINTLQLGFQAYKNKKYQTAISYFDKVLSMDSTVLFYKGIASIECGDYITALNSFIQLTGDSTSQYNIQSHWYIALTWLKLDQPANAKPHLNWLMKNNRFYGNKANALLKEIEESKK